MSQETITWTPADMLPDDNTTVLMFGPAMSDPVWFGYYEDGDWFATDGAKLTPDFEITHWASIPRGPLP